MTSTFYPQLVEVLRNAGCVFVRQGKGSHEIWQSPVNRKNFSVPFTIKSKLHYRTLFGIFKIPIEYQSVTPS